MVNTDDIESFKREVEVLIKYRNEIYAIMTIMFILYVEKKIKIE